MKQMKSGYANGGLVEDSMADEIAEGEMPSGTDELCRQKTGAPNERTWNQGPGVRSNQDYGKSK